MKETHSVVVPSALVLSIPWTWKDLLRGLEAKLVETGVAVDAAVARLSEEEQPSELVVELAGCSPSGSDVIDHVRRLAAQESGDGQGKEFWLYLVLRWVYENANSFDDPLGVVEEVYADFDYPESIVPFVRYMPSDEPDMGSKDLNEGRLYRRWERYLEAESKRLAG